MDHNEPSHKEVTWHKLKLSSWHTAPWQHLVWCTLQERAALPAQGRYTSSMMQCLPTNALGASRKCKVVTVVSILATNRRSAYKMNTVLYVTYSKLTNRQQLFLGYLSDRRCAQEPLLKLSDLNHTPWARDPRFAAACTELPHHHSPSLQLGADGMCYASQLNECGQPVNLCSTALTALLCSHLFAHQGAFCLNNLWHSHRRFSPGRAAPAPRGTGRQAAHAEREGSGCWDTLPDATAPAVGLVAGHNPPPVPQ